MANMVKETDWEQATTKIAIIANPTLVPLPFGKEIESPIFDNDFAKEMQKISSEHGFWAKTMSNVLKQKETENDTNTTMGRVMSSRASSRQCDPACTVTKEIHELTIATSGPFVETSVIVKNHDNKQGNVRLFFYRNPTPARVEINNDNKEPEIYIPVQSANAPTKGNPATATAHSTTIPAATAAIPATGFPSKEFYAQLIEVMKNFQALQQPSKIVVESWDYKVIVNSAKLQTSMLQLMYAHDEIDWDDGTIKNSCPATFSTGFKNLQGRLPRSKQPSCQIYS